MADAYARTSGRVAVLSVHQGCGLTNAMTGITEAAKSRTPLLVLAADVAGSAVGSNFRIDQDALVAVSAPFPSECTVRGPRSTMSSGPTGRRPTAVARWCSISRSTSRRPRSPRAGASNPCRAAPRTAPDPDAVDGLARSAPRRRATGVPGGTGGAAVRPGDRRPGRPGRRAADHVRRRGRDVRGRGVRPRDLWWVRHAVGRRAGHRRGPGGGLGLQPDQLDHPPRPSPRSGDRAGPGRRRSSRPRCPSTGGSGRLGRRRSDRVGAWPIGWPGRTPAPATGPRTWLRRLRTEGRWPQVPFTDLSERDHDRSAGLERPVGRRAARQPPAGCGLRQLHGLPRELPGRARGRRLLLHPVLPVDRPGSGHRDRRRAGRAGPPAGARHRGRRLPDGDRRAGDRCPPGTRAARGGVRRRRLRCRGPPLRPGRRRPVHRAVPRRRSRGDRPRLRSGRD